ncbi:ferritin-like domain-containing protein [Nocardia sp. NPDC020380]|uniref:ferritin-like domain-containing protein n=1 Tax=Nocardia sp. NPDC020380 TaxID=3364309 RepID=UPI003788C51C
MTDSAQGGGTPSEIPNISGEGPLARTIAARGGLAAPEAPFVIEHREALIYMLCQAAELEHGIMCQYLFAAFSLKQHESEGLTAGQVEMATRWQKLVSHVATQEMLHLALVHNLLSAIGAAPHMSRPNLPLPAAHYPAGVQLALIPFGEEALRHFLFLERPEGMDLQDAEGLAMAGRAAPLMQQGEIVPRLQDFATVGHLYRSIEHGIQHLAEKYGERWLFVGPPRAQATEKHFRWPELVPVTDVASARRAIDTILEQGEGARGDWRDAHFGQFVKILDEYEQCMREDPGFDPVRPVLAANVRAPERVVEVPLIGDQQTARVTDLFNVGYEVLLQIFERFFAHTDETDAQLQTLADATVDLMFRVIKPLGELITTLPAGPEYPGRTVGPSFELFYETDYLMPHREAAWALITERLGEAVNLSEGIRTECDQHVATELASVSTAFGDIQRTLAAHFPAWDAHAQAAVLGLDPAVQAAARQRADEFASRVAGISGGGLTGELAELFQEVYALETADSAIPAVVRPRLADSVLRPLSVALLRAPLGAADGADSSAADAEGPGAAVDPGMTVADRLRALAVAATRLRARSDLLELVEATAALQDLACAVLPAGERVTVRAQLAELQAGLPGSLRTAKNGPYLATNAQVVDHLGLPLEVPPTAALCRCGASASKPLCDGSHARVGFNDAKDPGRVPDQRDVYQGEQVTIYDNRGICQHSGLCTDRLAAVFRAGGEPFVTPNGGRLDEVVRTVRGCPSGALAVGFDGVEARELTDWHGTREPVIEVTQDGPYRIRGSIPLAGPGGAEIERAAGASTEHYALCRCGQSQNKPFCSGMHWYVDFHDPVPAPGQEPTLFEWAGGYPALYRLTGLLYEKLIPDDESLATVFAEMDAELPQREAEWTARAFGAPRTADEPLTRPALTEAQRDRWTALYLRAARTAGLPADPEFRSALAAFAEWSAGADGIATAGGVIAPDWNWGPLGPPAYPVEEPATETAEPALPGPDESVGFAAHIKPLFRDKDQRSMSFVFDLWSHEDVSKHATEILHRLGTGDMPCDGAWPPEKTEVFRRWTESGMLP